MTGEIILIATGAGVVTGWLAKHFQARPNGNGNARFLAALRAEMKADREQLVKEVTNTITLTLLEAELRRRE